MVWVSTCTTPEQMLPMHKDSATELSIIAEELGAKAIADFVSHPHDGDHFVHIGWEEAVAGCEILEAYW